MDRSRGLSLPWVLFLIFMILKLTCNINWSWWWVTSPLWIAIGLILLITPIVTNVRFRRAYREEMARVDRMRFR